jgi:hypothetical protein
MFPGFLVGCAETLEYIMYVSATVLVIGEFMTELTGLTRWIEPLWWLIFFVSSLCIHIYGGNFFWQFNFVFAIIIYVILIFYWFATIPYADFSAFAPFAENSGQFRLVSLVFFFFFLLILVSASLFSCRWNGRLVSRRSQSILCCVAYYHLVVYRH